MQTKLTELTEIDKIEKILYILFARRDKVLLSPKNEKNIIKLVKITVLSNKFDFILLFDKYVPYFTFFILPRV